VDNGVDLARLRGLVGEALRGFGAAHTHDTLPAAFDAVGLSEPPAEGHRSKAERVEASLNALPDDQLPDVAKRLLSYRPVPAVLRNAIQDLLWERRPVGVPARVRREMAQEIDLAELVGQGDRFRALLRKLWVLDEEDLAAMVFGASSRSLAALVERHVFRNDDWSAVELFERLKVFEAGDARFAAFLEGMVHPRVLPDEEAQRRLVGVFNRHLRAVSVEMCEVGSEEGYPVFEVVSGRGARGRRPKNVIFGSSAKPDLRLLDAIDNDVEAVDSPQVLVYDRPVGAEGLRWCDLQSWWQETQGLEEGEEAKRTLYARLRSCLAESSPPQRLLFDLYHQIHGAQMPERPALLPEVWRHWDPKTVLARGKHALVGHRMDFLLLLPHGRRVVFEVDGAHHYSTDGRPDPGRYAQQVAEDRQLKLHGYEVYRFGGAELAEKATARTLLEQFLADLWQYHELPGLPV
jgi:very-short-patch-repair endonuclease